MAQNPHSLGRIFSPRMIEAAFRTFDKATLAVVVGAWTMAFFIVVFALYTLHLSSSLQRDLAAAEAMEPLLPKIERKPAATNEIKPMIDNLEKKFPELKFTPGRDGEIQVTASDGAHFRLWLGVLSYMDTISPQYRWNLKEFCVGLKCKSGRGGKEPMRALLTPEKVTFGLSSARKGDTDTRRRKNPE